MLQTTTHPGSDYINASFIDVSTSYTVHQICAVYLPVTSYVMVLHCAGLQAAWSIHCHSDSSGEYCEWLLADDLGVPEQVYCHALQDEGGWKGTQKRVTKVGQHLTRVVNDLYLLVLFLRQEACHTYLPASKGDCEVYGKTAVKLVSQDTSVDYVIRKLEIYEDGPHPQSPTPSDQHTVTVFHFLRWPKHGCPRGTSALLELMEYINKTQMSSGNKPITVMCKYGQQHTCIVIHDPFTCKKHTHTMSCIIL